MLIGNLPTDYKGSPKIEDPGRTAVRPDAVHVARVHLPGIMLSLCLAACGGGGSSGGDGPQTQPPPQPPPASPATVSLTAAPTALREGEQTTLVWASENATSCNASGAWSGSRPLSGSETVTPMQGNYAFTLTCNGSGGNASDSVSVAVSEPDDPTLNLQANPAVTNNLTDIILTWLSKNTTTCTASGAWSGTKETEGFEVLPPLQAMAEFHLSCSGTSGSVTKTVAVEVLEQPSLTFSASAAEVHTNESVDLVWSSENADACEASDAWSGAKAASGAELVGPLSQPSTFTLACFNAAGTISASAFVDVTPPPPPSLTLAATAEMVPAGAITMLNWSGSQISNCVASGDWGGARDNAGIEPVGPLTASASYTLTCDGPAQSFIETVAVSVVDIPSTHAPGAVGFYSAEFVTVGGRPEHEGHFAPAENPIAGVAGQLLHVVMSGLPDQAEFWLVDELGNDISRASLDPLAGAPGLAKYFGEVAVPTVRFRVRATGTDTSGATFEVFSKLFAPQQFAASFGGAMLSVFSGELRPVILAITNHSSQPDFVLEIEGSFLQTSSQALSIPSGETHEVTLMLDVPDTTTPYGIFEISADVYAPTDPINVNSSRLQLMALPLRSESANGK